jgi:predicted CopG family antitoxin
MTKKLTITVSDEVYEGLYRRVGARRISKFLEGLARRHVVEADLESAYREAALDEERERVAREWIEGLIGDSLPDDKPRA